MKPPAFKFNNGAKKKEITEESAVKSVEEQTPFDRAEQDLQLENFIEEDAEIQLDFDTPLVEIAKD